MAYPLADTEYMSIQGKGSNPVRGQIRCVGEESDRFGEISAMISSMFGEGRAVTGDSVALRRRIEPLERRVSELCRAAVRISASLDPDTVLQEVVDSAPVLTGARYGLITTVDEAGPASRFVGSGVTAAQFRQLKAGPTGRGFRAR